MRSRRPMPRFEPTLWFAQAVIAVFRVYARGVEVFGSGRKQERARILREQMAEISSVSRQSQEQIKQGNIEQGLEQLERFMDGNGNFRESQNLRDSRLHLQAMRIESETLKQIRDSAGGNTETAILNYQRYIADHPDSQLAYSYLGGDLRKLGRFEESLAAYYQALRLKDESRATHSAVTNLAIGNVLQDMGRVDDAILEYQKITDKDNPDSSDGLRGIAYLYLGEVLKLKGKNSEACAAWKQAVRMDSTGHIRTEALKRLKE